MSQSNFNLIGGDSSITNVHNLLSGHSSVGSFGLYINSDCSNNSICGNYIGTNWEGTDPMGNYIGIQCQGNCNVIGGTQNGSVQMGNVISGNQYGIMLAGEVGGNLLAGNYIGLAYDGTSANPNNLVGIYNSATLPNQIGTSQPDGRNVIAGNTGMGIFLLGNLQIVRGNYFGTTAAGNYQFPNYGRDIQVQGWSNWLGGPNAGDGNLFCSGLQLVPNGQGNTVAGNWIGVLADFSTPAEPLTNGIECTGTGQFLGLPGGPGNLIAHVSTGINLNSGSAANNGMFANTICATSSASISRLWGANGNKSAPVISDACTLGIQGTAAAGDYIEIFKAEPRSGQGGSQQVLAAVTADGSGNWSWIPTGINAGDYICALATDSLNNTSLFSNNVILREPTPTVTATPTITATSTITPTATISPTSSIINPLNYFVVLEIICNFIIFHLVSIIKEH